jgi:Leucine-rich repeat (LRR) protein
VLHLYYNNTKLSVSAGGTLSNNTYKWYNGNVMVKTTTGDSTYTPSVAGNYSVAVTNSVATQLTLFSDSVVIGKPSNIQDSLALVDLYNSTNGPKWYRNAGWLAGPVRNWQGITLDTGGRVIDIYLGNNQLSGSLNESLGNLTKLQLLDLENNQLNGNIPSTLGSLSNLKSLLLLYNQLSGYVPSTLGNLTNLQFLDIGNNQLNGNIPTMLGNLKNLSELFLDNNQLSGSIPTTFSSLTNLQYLTLAGNKLSGTIPSSLGNLINLQSLYLENNQLNGSIPSSLGNLINLQSLYLGTNQLNGSIPATLGNLSKLGYLDISLNQLSGAIPSAFGNLDYINWLVLSHNQISGGIPSSLGNLTKLNHFDLTYNHISALPSLLGTLTKVNFFINYNYLNFDGIELVPRLDSIWVYAPQDTILPLHFNSKKLSVSAGGTLSNNTYKWYNGNTLKATMTGDSTYKPSFSGKYSVAVTNSIANELTCIAIRLI